MEKEFYTAEELAALFKEIRADEAAAKREDCALVREGSLPEDPRREDENSGG